MLCFSLHCISNQFVSTLEKTFWLQILISSNLHINQDKILSLKIIFSMLFPLFCNLRYVFRLMMNFFPMTGYGYIDFDICYKKFLFVCLFIYKACNKQIGKEELTCVRPIYASSLSQQHTHPLLTHKPK